MLAEEEAAVDDRERDHHPERPARGRRSAPGRPGRSPRRSRGPASTRRTGSEVEVTMLAAFGPACITEVTRLTIQVPAKPRSARPASTGAAPRPSRRARRPARSGRPRRRARRPGRPPRCPGRSPGRAARRRSPGRTRPASRPARPARRPRPERSPAATLPASATTVDRGGQPEHQVGHGQRGRAQPEPLGGQREDAAPSHWLTDSLNRPPPRLTRWKSATVGRDGSAKWSRRAPA